MGEVKGFLKHKRQEYQKAPVDERVKHWNEFTVLPDEKEMKTQGARCMDCGVPFCQWGCPIGNIIPSWNDLVYKGQWKDAIERLHKTNNFPEFTGRVCPAPCENSCTLTINAPAVTIKNIELSIIEHAYDQGLIKAEPPKSRSGMKVAVIGSGPAGLACADQLNKKGHKVTVYEKNAYIGGLLTLGIPNFKLEKSVVERRINRMRDEGVDFKTGKNVGVDVDPQELRKQFDALVLCGGAEQPRDLPVPGREFKGIYFAMQFLSQQTTKLLGGKIDSKEAIDAKGKRVVVLGGGDTGSDCVGTSNRQGAILVKQFELLSKPRQERAGDNPWPQWATILRTSTSHEEGCERDYSILTKKFTGDDKGNVKKLHAVRVDWSQKDPTTGRSVMKEIAGSEFEVECDLVFLAMGFLGPVKSGLVDKLGVELDQRGNVKADSSKMTSVPGVFTAGDMTRGQSLVVWAIQEGRAAAEGVHQYFVAKKAKAQEDRVNRGDV
ncbi:MAG: glutamate synthase subunit beta [Candidatus Omnitrophica bacterium]|nr:glutamate synthase subunit beta [Candidatus Omnitrophota bacterium]